MSEKRQLWDRINAASPQLADDITGLSAQFPGMTLTFLEIDGVVLKGAEPKSAYTLDESFLMRLSAADRQKYYYDVKNPPSALDKAKANRRKKR
jgi:hypothetical protein